MSAYRPRLNASNQLQRAQGRVVSMETRLKEMDDDVATLTRLISDLRAVGQRLVERADQTRPGHKAFHARLADAIAQLSLLGRTQHGMLLQLLDRAQQHRAIPGGAPAWLATTQGVSDGHARTLVSDAKRLAAEPEIAGRLTEGAFSPDATRVLARAVKAVSGADHETRRQVVADTICQIEDKGVTHAAKQIPHLEKKASPGGPDEILAAQRARSYARVVELDNGEHRYHVLLDAERATHLNTALEAHAAQVYRRRQRDQVEALPADVRTTEQIAAHAFARLAAVYLTAGDADREATFQTPAIVDGGLHPAGSHTESSSPHPPSASAPSDPDGSQADIVVLDQDGSRTSPDEQSAETRPLRRLAARLQRSALVYRERRCTFPGCSRSAGRPLHDHHVTPLRDGNLAELKNVVLYCPEHRAAI
jgi:hypothetical protein